MAVVVVAVVVRMPAIVLLLPKKELPNLLKNDHYKPILPWFKFILNPLTFLILSWETFFISTRPFFCKPASPPNYFSVNLKGLLLYYIQDIQHPSFGYEITIHSLKADPQLFWTKTFVTTTWRQWPSPMTSERIYLWNSRLIPKNWGDLFLSLQSFCLQSIFWFFSVSFRRILSGIQPLQIKPQSLFLKLSRFSLLSFLWSLS